MEKITHLEWSSRKFSQMSLLNYASTYLTKLQRANVSDTSISFAVVLEFVWLCPIQGCSLLFHFTCLYFAICQYSLYAWYRHFKLSKQIKIKNEEIFPLPGIISANHLFLTIQNLFLHKCSWIKCVKVKVLICENISCVFLLEKIML